MSNKLETKRSNIHGMGIFAKQNIKRHEKFRYLSERLTPSPAGSFYKDVSGKFYKPDNPHIIIDESTAHKYIVQCSLKYINSSDNPNVYYRDDDYVVAMRNIKAGEELTDCYLI